MHIINIGKTPRYCLYAGKHGRVLPPGAASLEFALSFVSDSIMWRDIEAGYVLLRLSDADRKFLNRILEADARQYTPPVEPPVAEIAPPVAEIVSPVASPVTRPAAEIAPTVAPPVAPGAALSIEQLKLSNKGIRNKS